jgi:hypothetical protein
MIRDTPGHQIENARKGRLDRRGEALPKLKVRHADAHGQGTWRGSPQLAREGEELVGTHVMRAGSWVGSFTIWQR